MKDGNQQQRSITSLCASTAFIVVLMVTAVASMGAQTSTTGDIAGVVIDPTAAVVPGGSVTLQNLDTGSSTSTTSSSQGAYNFPLVQPGNYSIAASGAGFQKITRKVTVALGSSVTANLQLPISSQSESIDVTDEVIGVQTEDANLETTFNAQQIAVLPNPGNDLRNL